MGESRIVRVYAGCKRLKKGKNIKRRVSHFNALECCLTCVVKADSVSESGYILTLFADNQVSESGSNTYILWWQC